MGTRCQEVAVLGRERSAKLMSFHTFNGEPDEGLVYEACVFLPGHKPLGHRDALRCRCGRWVSFISLKHIEVPTKHRF